MSLTKTVLGGFLVLFGVLFTLTFLGAIIGIPMISVGLAMIGDSAIGRRRRAKSDRDVVVVDRDAAGESESGTGSAVSIARRWGRHYARVRRWIGRRRGA